MYSGVIALGGPKSWEGILASLYFILLVILGNCILYNYNRDPTLITLRNCQPRVTYSNVNSMKSILKNDLVPG